MKRLIIATALLVIVAAPASAQRKPYSLMNDEEKANAKVSESVDKQYRNALERTRKDATEVPMDPWENMRGTPEQPKKKN